MTSKQTIPTVTLAEKSPEVDLTTWDFGVSKSVTKGISEVLKQMLADEPPDIWIGSTSAIDQHLNAYVELPLGQSDAHSPYWQFSFREVVLEACEGFVSFSSGTIDDEEGRDFVSGAAASLRRLATEIEALVQPIENKDGSETEI